MGPCVIAILYHTIEVKFSPVYRERGAAGERLPTRLPSYEALRIGRSIPGDN